VTSIQPAPTLEEAAAIAAALVLADEDATAPPARISAWALAMRRPELSHDEIREIMKAAR